MAIALNASYVVAGKKVDPTTSIASVQCTGTNRALIVLCMGYTKGGTETMDSVIWDSGGDDQLTLTKLTVQRNGDDACYIFVSDTEPAEATHTLLITPTDNGWSWNGGVWVAVSLSGVDTSSLHDGIDSTIGNGTGPAANPSITVSGDDGDWGVGGIAHITQANFAASTDTTEMQDVLSASLAGAAYYNDASGSGSDLSITGADQGWVFAAVNVNLAAAAGVTLDERRMPRGVQRGVVRGAL